VSGRARWLAAAVAVSLLLAVAGSVGWLRRDRPVDDATVRTACRAVVAYRDALGVRTYLAARKDLAAALPTLGTDDREPAVGVRAYAQALLGAPADGSGHLLLSAAGSCRQAGAPALYRDLAPLLD
jgi:hypothetical protein